MATNQGYIEDPKLDSSNSMLDAIEYKAHAAKVDAQSKISVAQEESRRMVAAAEQESRHSQAGGPSGGDGGIAESNVEAGLYADLGVKAMGGDAVDMMKTLYDGMRDMSSPMSGDVSRASKMMGGLVSAKPMTFDELAKKSAKMTAGKTGWEGLEEDPKHKLLGDVEQTGAAINSQPPALSAAMKMKEVAVTNVTLTRQNEYSVGMASELAASKVQAIRMNRGFGPGGATTNATSMVRKPEMFLEPKPPSEELLQEEQTAESWAS